MRAPQFKQWFARLSALNPPQRRVTLAALGPVVGHDQITALIAHIRATLRRCPALRQRAAPTARAA